MSAPKWPQQREVTRGEAPKEKGADGAGPFHRYFLLPVGLADFMTGTLCGKTEGVNKNVMFL